MKGNSGLGIVLIGTSPTMMRYKDNRRTTLSLQHGFFLSSTHQILDKLVAETQEIISHKQCSLDNGLAQLLEDAENCKQLLPKLQETIRCDSHPIENRLVKIKEELMLSITVYLNDMMETMLRKSIEQCPQTLTNQTVLTELRKSCEEKLKIAEDFLQNGLVNYSSAEIMSGVSEAEQALAILISDRATDEVLEALIRYKKGLGISDSSHSYGNNIQTPDTPRSRSCQGSDNLAQFDSTGLDLPKLGLDSPTKLEYLNLATPQLQTKRRSLARKVRPQSVIALGIENLSLTNIPDTTEKQSSEANSSTHSRNESPIWPSKRIECYDSITELPSQSLTLQHLVKSRPKRAKTHTSKKIVRATDKTIVGVSDGIDTFFRSSTETPSTLTPLVSPTSEECSSLSFVDSPTLSRDDGGRFSNMSSGEITPVLEEQRSVQLDKVFPLVKNSYWALRSKSSDNLEKDIPSSNKPPPMAINKVQIVKETSTTRADHIKTLEYNERREKLKTSDFSMNIKTDQQDKANMTKNPKPRPWSVLGHESQNEFGCKDLNKSDDESTCNDSDVVLISGQTPGGSIVGITPGAITSFSNNLINPKS